MGIEYKKVRDILAQALKEDIQSGDVTSISCIPSDQTADAVIMAKAEGIICGLDLVEYIFRVFDTEIKIENCFEDGDLVKKSDVVTKISGNARAMLSVERTLLNFLQGFSGVATTANRYAKELEGTKTEVLDTRKTIPGMRYLQKYAVATGGATNHRKGLYDMILIKDNHIQANGSITDAVEKARKEYPDLKIEVECDTLKQVQEAKDTDCDWIMLDNMNKDDMKKAIDMIKTQKIEASGGITLANIREIAELGVDYISVGALTHSFKALDLSMKMSIIE